MCLRVIWTDKLENSQKIGEHPIYPAAIETLLSRSAICSALATRISDHDGIMCVCCEQNGKESNSTCAGRTNNVVIRHTSLGGIGVIQQMY